MIVKRKILCALKPGPLGYYADVPPDVRQYLGERGFELIEARDFEQFLAELPQAEIAITMEFKSEWLPLASRLRWVASYSAGRERIAEAELRAAGIRVTFGRYHGRIMAETVLGMMLLVARGLGTAYRLQQKGEWGSTALCGQVATLQGKTCVILGLGSIGSHVARLTKAFGMINIGIKRTLSGAQPNVDRVMALADLRQALPLADHLVIILPNGPETDRLIGPDELALLKPSAALYNVGRGNCLDEAALCLALKEKRIHWACLDVFQTEPLPKTSPLWALDNLSILPHASAFAPEYFGYFFEEFLADFPSYLREA